MLLPRITSSPSAGRQGKWGGCRGAQRHALLCACSLVRAARVVRRACPAWRRHALQRCSNSCHPTNLQRQKGEARLEEVQQSLGPGLVQAAALLQRVQVGFLEPAGARGRTGEWAQLGRSRTAGFRCPALPPSHSLSAPSQITSLVLGILLPAAHGAHTKRRLFSATPLAEAVSAAGGVSYPVGSSRLSGWHLAGVYTGADHERFHPACACEGGAPRQSGRRSSQWGLQSKASKGLATTAAASAGRSPRQRRRCRAPNPGCDRRRRNRTKGTIAVGAAWNTKKVFN